jgi:hypothetical protein
MRTYALWALRDARALNQGEIAGRPHSIGVSPPDLDGACYSQLEVTNGKRQ